MLISFSLALFVFVVTTWFLWDMLESTIFIPFLLACLTFFISHIFIFSGQRFQPKIIQSDSYKIVVWNDGKKENTMLLSATNSLYYVPENLLEVDGLGNLRMKE